MSLKSFDKFCEKIILAEPGSEKEIFDERQKQIQGHLVIESMIFFILLMLVHCVVSDLFYKWSESNLVPFLLFAHISVIFYIIKAGIKGCYIGVNGIFSQYVPAAFCISLGALNGFRFILEIAQVHFEIIKNGIVTDNFLWLCVYLLLIITGILSIVIIKKYIKENGEQT